MEEFAQSRGDDDLFDDELIPIEPAVQPSEPIAEQLQQLKLNNNEKSRPTREKLGDAVPHGRGRGRGRGRGTGGETRQGGLSESRFAPKSSKHITPDAEKSEKQQSEPLPLNDQPTVSSQPEDAELTTSAIPTGPAAASKPPAVRGDRTQTGGLKKPKLTEEELSAKLAAAKERSQNLAAAHARAQADAENFAERERIAQQKRKEEAVERKALEGEREKNRARKMKALGGREWDAEKNEEDFRAPRYGDRTRRGGPPPDQDLSNYEWKEDTGRDRGRGRGRGGGGRGRGRGNDQPQKKPDVSKVEEFPSLPQSSTPKGKAVGEGKKPQQTRMISDSAPAGASWADQVESSEAAAKA